MAVTITDVRNLLDNLSSKQVRDETISANILDATALVNTWKSSTASTADVDLAVKRTAVWLSYVSYSEAMSFQRGGTPLLMTRKEESFRNIAELFINKISSVPVDLEDIKRRFEEALRAQDPTSVGIGDSAAWAS